MTEHLSSPPLFRKWGAISLVAGALERKVWVRTMGSDLYPNLYVILVAPPGVGKTEITWRVRELWKSLESHHVGSSSVTKASMMDELAEAVRRWIIKNPKPGETPVESFNSLLLCVNELGVFLPAYDNEFMNALTDLWDCKDYSEKRRHGPKNKEPIDIKKAQLNMIAACTPSYLQGTLPEGAWDQGFISRTILIYSGERQLRSLFDETSIDMEKLEHVKDMLADIASLWGEIKFTKDAAELIDNFHLTGGEPQPDHPKLLSYKIRRTVHLLKLCMVASVSRSDDLTITKGDFETASNWLFEAEAYMPEIFKAMAQGGAGKVMEETWYYIFTIYSKENKPVLKHRLIQYLQERVPVHNIQNVIDMMEQGKMIEKRITTAGTAYVPASKPKPH